MFTDLEVAEVQLRGKGEGSVIRLGGEVASRTAERLQSSLIGIVSVRPRLGSVLQAVTPHSQENR